LNQGKIKPLPMTFDRHDSLAQFKPRSIGQNIRISMIIDFSRV
jgi:hypothetical protein